MTERRLDTFVQPITSSPVYDGLTSTREETYSRPRLTYLQQSVDLTAAHFLPESSLVRQNLRQFLPEAIRLSTFLLPGKLGLAATLGVSILNQASFQDDLRTQGIDALLGAGRGLTERALVSGLAGAQSYLPASGHAFNYSPLAGAISGIGFRAIEQLGNHDNYFDTQTREFRGFIPGAQRAIENTFTTGSSLMDGAQLWAWTIVGGSLPGSNPMLQRALGAGVMGLYTGAEQEYSRQQSSGAERLDYSRLISNSLLNAGEYATIGALAGRRR